MKTTLIFLFLSIASFCISSCNQTKHDTNKTTTTQLAAKASKPKLDSTSVVVKQENYNFGKIKKGQQVDHIYIIENTGSNPFIISNILPGCGCTLANYNGDPILPGKKAEITLRFDSSNFDGIVHKFAQVYGNTKTSPIVLTFTANIK